jgi:uracil-DNA glycosylase
VSIMWLVTDNTRGNPMLQLFDPGCCEEPFRSLASDYPGEDVYPPSQFRVEWGPIFHRGRLDGSARVVVIGQDPAQHETIVRRILVGEAGRRLQGFLAKLGITRSYTLINTYLYSVYGSVKAKTRRDPRLIDYRNRWLKALLVDTQVEAVLGLGGAAAEAWQFWKATPAGQSSTVAFAPITHPTQPESSSKNDRTKLAEATRKLLANWNAGLETLAPAIRHPDSATPLVRYADAWREGDRIGLPDFDYPAGLPAWMRENDGWARRVGADDLGKRRNITITITKGVVS